jgi:hypothetical protein
VPPAGQRPRAAIGKEARTRSGLARRADCVAPGSRWWHSWGVRLAKWIGGAVWAGSWYLMYLEITRWRHVRPSLAFNSDPVPGSGIRPRPGLPLILLYIACAAAPLGVVAALAGESSQPDRKRLNV